MIKSITVTSLQQARQVPYLENITQNLWLTTVDPEDKHEVEHLKQKLKKRGIPCFAQYFRDWSDEAREEFIKINIDEQGPREQHINNIISFIEPYVASETQYDLGINCFAGISRSTALCIIVWAMQGKTPMEALDATLEVRPQAWPNLRMLKFASNRLGIDLFLPVKNWKQENKEVLAIWDRYHRGY